MKITIAGTAGRKDDAAKLNKDVFYKMSKAVANAIISINTTKEKMTLVSGGAAWADHIAVFFFITDANQTSKPEQKAELELYLPAELEESGFHDTGVFDWKTNPGGTANYYHKIFSQKRWYNSIDELNYAKGLGAKIAVYPGFFERNLEMAKSDYVIALTFGENGVKDGGTKHMTDNFLKTHSADKLIHIPIQTL